MRVIFDKREPDDHPRLSYLPQGWDFERDRLETGDLALAAIAGSRSGGEEDSFGLDSLHDVRARAVPARSLKTTWTHYIIRCNSVIGESIIDVQRSRRIPNGQASCSSTAASRIGSGFRDCDDNQGARERKPITHSPCTHLDGRALC